MIHGGAACETNKDCGNFGPDYDNPEFTGGKCEGGMCVCFEGYTCPHCNTKGNPENVVSGDLKCPDSALQSVMTYSLLLFVLLCVYLTVSSLCYKKHQIL